RICVSRADYGMGRRNRIGLGEISGEFNVEELARGGAEVTSARAGKSAENICDRRHSAMIVRRERKTLQRSTCSLIAPRVRRDFDQSRPLDKCLVQVPSTVPLAAPGGNQLAQRLPRRFEDTSRSATIEPYA